MYVCIFRNGLYMHYLIGLLLNAFYIMDRSLYALPNTLSSVYEYSFQSHLFIAFFIQRSITL